MPTQYKAAVVGCGRMGGTIDDEVKDLPTLVHPYSHSAGYKACPRTNLVAGADPVEEKARKVCQRWDIPRAYTDYREMIERERPDIISIATRPNTHAEIALFAAEHGVKGIYCEKPLCCSMAEADAMLAACQRAGVKFNYGTNRRYITTYAKVREFIDKGGLGAIHGVVALNSGSIQWSHTHTSDLLMYLAGDPEMDYVQGTLAGVDEADFADNALERDPSLVSGFVQFKNGVRAFCLSVAGYEFEVSGSEGKIRMENDALQVRLRKKGPMGSRWSGWYEQPFGPVAHDSGCLNLINDLVEALDTSRETKGNLPLACRSQEMMLGFVESHRQSGARVKLPLANRTLAIRPKDW